MNLKRYSLFLLDHEPGRDDCKLRLRVRWIDGIVAFSLGYRVDPLKWSPETQRCKISTTHGDKKVQANVINKEIQKYSRAAETVFDSFESRGMSPTKAQFRNAFNVEIGKPTRASVRPTSLFDLFDVFVSSMGSQNAWTEATYTKFSAIKGHLESFDPTLSLSALSDDKLHGFLQYMHKVPLRNTTISKNVSFVRWFLRWAFNNDYYSGKLHETFRPKLKGTDGNSREVIHLSWEELHHLLSFPVPEDKQHLARVRDVFCFCCFTGLRYSDVKKLSRSDVRPGYISVVTQKTGDGLQIDLNSYSRAILDKYAGFPFEKNLALPVISNDKMNENLKVLGELVGFKDPRRIVYFMGNVRHEEVFPLYSLLTTHCGRRTFIVNALFLGIPSDVVMKWTGHKDYKAMKPYIKIVDALKAQEMKKFDRVVDPPKESDPEMAGTKSGTNSALL